MLFRSKVKNVVDFGAFVDIGIKESALIHVSELSDRFVEDPMEVLKVGDVKQFRIISLDEVRKRIGLSLKSERREGSPSGSQGGTHSGSSQSGGTQSGGALNRGPQSESRGEPRRVVTVRKATDAPAGQGSRGAPSAGQGNRSAPPAGQAGSGSRSSGGYRSDRPVQTSDDEGTSYNPFADLLKNMKK